MEYITSIMTKSYQRWRRPLKMARTVYEREIDEGHFNFTSLARPPCSPTSSPKAFPVSPGNEVACCRARNNPSRTFPFRLFNSPVSNRPSYLVCFVFLIQTTWCSPGNLPFVVSLIMHTYARRCTCIKLHLKKTVHWGTITWSEMGKQNIQAKKVYSSWPLNKGTEDICTGSAST